MIALTSGRFDPPHLGHLCNIKRIFGTRGVTRVKVYVLDYKERRFPLEYCVQVLREAFSDYFPSIQFYTNNTHFAKITAKELSGMDFQVYCGGNLEVLRRIEKEGFPTKYFERAYDFAASKYIDEDLNH